MPISFFVEMICILFLCAEIQVMTPYARIFIECARNVEPVFWIIYEACRSWKERFKILVRHKHELAKDLVN